MATENGDGRIPAELALTPESIALRVSQLKEELTTSLLQNPAYLQSAGKNLLNSTSFFASWRQSNIPYEVVNEVERDRRGRRKSESLTITAGDPNLDAVDSVKFIYTYGKRGKGTHIEVNTLGGGFVRDTEQAFKDARLIVLYPLLIDVA